MWLKTTETGSLDVVSRDLKTQEVSLRSRSSSSTGKPFFLSSLTTLFVNPRASNSSFWTKFSTPSLVFSDPGTRLFLSAQLRSRTVYLDLGFASPGRDFVFVFGSESDASLSSFSVGHSVGKGSEML